MEWFRSAMEARPSDYQAPCLMASALAGLGRDEESIEAYRLTRRLAEKHLQIHPGDARAIYFSALACAQTGDADEARARDERAIGMDPDEPQVIYNVACVFTMLGMFDEAIELLREVMTHGDWWRGWCANDPDLVPLHGDPRYVALVKDR